MQQSSLIYQYTTVTWNIKATLYVYVNWNTTGNGNEYRQNTTYQTNKTKIMKKSSARRWHCVCVCVCVCPEVHAAVAARAPRRPRWWLRLLLLLQVMVSLGRKPSPCHWFVAGITFGDPRFITIKGKYKKSAARKTSPRLMFGLFCALVVRQKFVL